MPPPPFLSRGVSLGLDGGKTFSVSDSSFHSCLFDALVLCMRPSLLSFLTRPDPSPVCCPALPLNGHLGEYRPRILRGITVWYGGGCRRLRRFKFSELFPLFIIRLRSFRPHGIPWLVAAGNKWVPPSSSSSAVEASSCGSFSQKFCWLAAATYSRRLHLSRILKKPSLLRKNRKNLSQVEEG